MSDTLPPLPKPEHPFDSDDCTYACPEGFSADQMRSYAAAALAAAVVEPPTTQAYDELCAENERLIKYADHCNELIAAYKEAAQTAEPVLKYTGLFEYAHEHRLNYNELCKVVREAYSAPKEQP